MSTKHKKKKTAKKNQTPQAEKNTRPVMSSGRRTLNSVLLLLLCVILTASAAYTFFAQGGRSWRMYAPMLLLEIFLFLYAYATDKTAERQSGLNIASQVVCGAAAVAMAAFTVLSLLHF